MKIAPFIPFYPKASLHNDLEAFQKNVKEKFRAFYQQDIFDSFESGKFIVYRITSSVGNSLGLICLTHISEYEQGHILTHEETIEDKEINQLSLYKSRVAIVKPVLLTYPNHEWFDAYLEQYIADHQPFMHLDMENGEEHEFWAVNALDDMYKISHFFDAEVLKAYIADGHHRLSTFSKYKNQGLESYKDYVLTAYFPFSALHIYEFNRIIELAQPPNELEILNQLDRFCFIEPVKRKMKPRFKFNFMLFIGHQTYSCVWRPTYLNKLKDEPILLDVDLLNNVIFKKLFKVKDIRSDERIKYIEGQKGLDGFIKTFQKSSNAVGFFLYPVQFNDFQTVSELGLKLPPKSTWFEPRMRNGLMVYTSTE